MVEHREYKDCVVIGGGPAGSAFAGIASRYAPEASILLLEKARFPRFRLGESTIPVANTVLRELGVYDELYNGGAVKKVGISFVWGADRMPWNADYLQIGGASEQLGPERTIDVLGQDLSTFSERFAPSRMPFVGFNVERSRFDQMLLERARVLGAECREGVGVTEILRENGVVCGVRYRDDQGLEGTIATPFVLDASGLSALLTRGQRIRDPDMNNFAVHGYFSGAEWKSTLSGTREATTVFIASVPLGWIWYFPIGADLMSVGFVTHRRHFRQALAGRDPEQLYRDALHSCPEIKDLLQRATLRDDILPQGQRVGVTQDWSSWAESAAGPGWAAAGDAAVFVDPILSSGVTLALQSGHRAAYTWLSVRRRPELDSRQLWQAYADYLRGEAFSFLQLARFFYANNRSAESWWWEAQRLLHARGRLELAPRQAFTLATAGFFPIPRAIGLEVVAPLVGKLAAGADFSKIHEQMGLDREQVDTTLTLVPNGPFSLALRSEPSPQGGGLLDVYHDLTTHDPELSHRIAALPSRIPLELQPVVELMQAPIVVSELLERAVTLLGNGARSAVQIREVSLELVRRAVIKGFARLEQAASTTGAPSA